MRFDRADDQYPPALRALPDPPRVLTTTGPLVRSRRVVAIVGSRGALPGSAAFAYALAYALAAEGLVVVSGGALGVDAAAHRGALAAGGATWAVLPCGRNACAPPENKRLFQAIALSPGGRLVWPLPDDRGAEKKTFRYRNGVLTALADDVVVVQAHFKSGSLNAAGWARSLGRRIWMVPAAPWMTSFCASNAWIASGLATPVWSATALLEQIVGRKVPWPTELDYRDTPVIGTDELGAAAEGRALGHAAERPIRQVTKRPGKKSRKPSPRRLPGFRSTDENAVIAALSGDPIHLDAIAFRARLPVSSTVTALLTLALEDVVVEGPDGFFRLQIAG